MIDGIEIVHVVAFDENQAIGFENKLAWHIPDDLKHFKEITHNSIIIMGRKTFESIGKALPHRENIVISRDVRWVAENTLRFGRVDTAVAYAVSLAKHQNKKSVFVIGGGEVYQQTQGIVDRIEATKVCMRIENADTHYPPISENEFSLLSSVNKVDNKSGINIIFNTFKRNT